MSEKEKIITFDDLARLLPDAEIGEDEDGQLVIYTNLQMAKDGKTVEEFKEPISGD